MSETATAVAEQPAPETTQTAGEIAAAAAAAAAATTAAAETATQTETTPATETAAPASGPPEKYALTVPVEGIVSAEGVQAFAEEARALGLTNAQAQASLERRIDGFLAQSDADLAALTADPTYGGAKLAETQKFAESALNRFAPKGTPHGDGLRSLLRESGRGNALGIVAFMAAIGKAMAEDRPVGGGDGRTSDAPVRLADAMYAGSTSKPADA